MRIVYLTPVGVLGGAERCLLHGMAAVRRAEPEVDLQLVVLTDGPLIGEAEKLGVRARLVPMPDELAAVGDSSGKGRSLGGAWASAWRALPALPATLPYMNRLRQVFADTRPDLIHSNGMKTHLLIRLAGWKEAPVLWHLHDFVGRRPIMARALRWAARRAAGAIAVSRAVGRDARAALPRLPIEVIYNVIDTDAFSPAPTDGRQLDALAGMPAAEPGTVRIGLVATFARWKGQDLFLKAAAQMVRDRPGQHVRFYVIGGPIYRTRGSQFSEQELRSTALGLGIAPQVGFIGFQPNTANVYRALDIVVHASTAPEPFGLTIIEAMACRKPVVVAWAGGAAELFTHNRDAVGVPPGDAVALASALQRLVDEPDCRQRLADLARRNVTLRFSHQRLGPEILAVYRRILPTRAR